jgi:hypothetical protein
MQRSSSADKTAAEGRFPHLQKKEKAPAAAARRSAVFEDTLLKLPEIARSFIERRALPRFAVPVR